jgi:hypothetical protein
MSSLGDGAKAAVKANFPDSRAQYDELPAPIVTIPPAHPGFGPIEICDDEVELTVNCGNFTHLHLANHDEGISTRERERRVVESLVAFLRDVFSDRMEFWGSHRGMGGCRARGSQGKLSRAVVGTAAFVWSGPLHGGETG